MASSSVLNVLSFKLVHLHVRKMSNFRRFVGQTAIVTGSSKGIGLACARRLAEEGAKVVISSRSKENVDKSLEALHKDGLTDISGLVCDVSSAQHRNALVEHALTLNGNSDIDIIVSNVANGAYRALLSAKESSWDKILDLNVKSHFQLVRECLPYMKRKNKASIVFMGTLGSYLSNPAELGVYSVSKASMVKMTKVLASELGGLNIRVNCVIPGLIDTEMAAPTMKNKKYVAYELSRSSAKRVGQPTDVAGSVAFLCSEDASYITGESLFVTANIIFTRV